MENIPRCSETQYPFVHLVKLFSQSKTISFMLASAQVLPAFTSVSCYGLLLHLLNTPVTMKGEPLKSIITKTAKQLFLGLRASEAG